MRSSGSQPPKGHGKIGQGGAGGRVTVRGPDVGDLDLDDLVPALAAHDLADLVRGDGHQPGSQPFRVPQRAELAPGDGPGGLDGILGHVLVAADDVADARHVVVMGTHDPGERIRVAGRGVRHGRCRDASHCRQFSHHAP